MSQQNVKAVVVTDADGVRGTIDTTSPTLNLRDPRALIRLEDGRQVLVPVEELRRQDDGSFAVMFSLTEAASAADGVPRRADAGATRGGEIGGGGDTVVVPIIAEQLEIGKRRVEGGGVRIRKVVHEHEEVVDEPLLREEVQVKRVAVGRVVDGPVPVRHVGDTMIIPLLEEVLVVEKRLMLKEELHVKKAQVETHRPQRVTLRSEEAFVERVGDEAAPGTSAGGDDEPALAQSPSE